MRRFTRAGVVPALVAALGAWLTAQQGSSPVVTRPTVPGERHLANLRQLTFGGENAEAYFSFEGTRLIFQSTRDGWACDQQYTMSIGVYAPLLEMLAAPFRATVMSPLP